MRKMKIVLLVCAVVVAGSSLASGEEDKVVSAFAGLDVNEVRTNDQVRVVLPKPLWAFKKGVVTMDWNGTASQVLCHAYLPKTNALEAVTVQIDGAVPEVCKRLGCELVESGKDKHGRQEWMFSWSVMSEWKIEMGVAPQKLWGKDWWTVFLSFHRPSFVSKLVETESERVPVPKGEPKGDIGDGQGEKWVRATFPEHADMILAKGYEAWLMEWVGIMRQNGHYKAMVQVDDLVNGSCELYCGPYHVHVTKPGTYSFPLEVFEKYKTYTEPKMELKSKNDDGFRDRLWFYRKSKGLKVE